MYNPYARLKNKVLSIKKQSDVNSGHVPNQTRSDDIYLVSFPRSGNTWVSFMIANVMNEYLKLGMEINFFNLRQFIYDVHLSKDIPQKLQYPPFRRIIKSHSLCTESYSNVILLIRDPREVLVSYYHFVKKSYGFDGTLSDFIKSERHGAQKWVEHTKGWLEGVNTQQVVTPFFYEDFKKEPEKNLSRLLSIMGFNIDPEIIKKAVAKSRPEIMKKAEAETVGTAKKRVEKMQLVRNPNKTNIQELSDEDIAFIESQSKDLLNKLNYPIQK